MRKRGNVNVSSLEDISEIADKVKALLQIPDPLILPRAEINGEDVQPYSAEEASVEKGKPHVYQVDSNNNPFFKNIIYATRGELSKSVEAPVVRSLM